MQPNQQPSREDFVKGLFALEPTDNFYTGKDARKKLITGVQKGVDAIKTSYGPSGTNAVIEHELRPFHVVTNDGKHILSSMKLADKVENMGLEILKEIADKSDHESGDGRKTSVILAGAILEEGLKCKESPMEIKKSLEECLPLILKSIDEQTRQISPLDVGNVARISSESEFIGNTLQEIYTEIGRDGIVEIENSQTPITTYEVINGVKLKGCKMFHEYMANDVKGRKAVFENPKVLVCQEKITSWMQLEPICRNLSEKHGMSELVLACDDIDAKTLQALASAHQAGIFKVLVIKMPVLWKDFLYEDFAKITGAKIVNPVLGTSLKTFSNSWLGTCEKIISSSEETIVLGTKDITDHLKALEEAGDDDSKRRIFWLQTKTAILKLGANSETELFYLRGKASDARNASYSALQHGVVAGGGIALMNCIKALPEDTIGGYILDKALRAPYKQIITNFGGEKELVVQYAAKDAHEMGFDAKTGKVTNMFESGIIDSSLVTKNAITNALSVVSNVLTTRLAITK